MEALTTYLIYTAMGFIGLVSAMLVVDFARRDSGLAKLRALAAELESERAKLRGCEERLSICGGKLEACEKHGELWRRERQQLMDELKKLREELEKKKRELNHLAKENRVALGLYEALAKGKIRIVDGDGNECRVLVDGSIICKDRLVWPEVG